MKRNTALKILNPILFVFFINQAVTAFFREHLSMDVFRVFHMGGGTILICLIAVHFILNFNWVKANYFHK